jgi:hypothetical protein
VTSSPCLVSPCTVSIEKTVERLIRFKLRSEFYYATNWDVPANPNQYQFEVVDCTGNTITSILYEPIAGETVLSMETHTLAFQSVACASE